LQSVFRTFFRRTARGEYPIEQSGTLRHLLVRITLNKVRRQGEHHRAGKRNVSTEIYLAGDEADLELAAKEPTAADATLLLKDLEDLQTGLTPAEADMVRMCLEGYSPSEVAARTGLSRWTVRRILNRLGHRLRSQLN
jgi:RNA polymerase sigma factor (sigma-70 family)